MFDVGFTITNLTSFPRNLKLQLNPLWLQTNQNDEYKIGNQEASLLCLEKSANIGELGGHSSTSLNLPFLAMDEGIFLIDQLQIIDNESGNISSLGDSCELYVMNTKNKQ